VKVGVLALQGAVRRHVEALDECGATAIEVRSAADLTDVDRLVLPGGESTTISMLLDRSGLREPIADRLAKGMPVFGTCAGMILLATDVLDGRPDQQSFGAIDLVVRRNGYGRQVDSFETMLDVDGLDAPFPATFIRAPVVVSAGSGVTSLAHVGDFPVLCRSERVLVAAFHPELSEDRQLHSYFLEEV